MFSFNFLGGRRRIAALAVIKDEAAYIHEWIFHYRHFGFTDLFLAVNRTTDNTLEILDKIKIKVPNIHVHNVDWMDKNRNGKPNHSIQRMSYAYFCEDILPRYHPNVTHVLLVDADEFWFPKDFSTKVIDTLPDHDYDVVSFYWQRQFGESETFKPPFFDERVAPLSGECKSLINLASTSKIAGYRAHCPLFADTLDVKHMDASGCLFQSTAGQQKQPRDKALDRQHPSYILHRMFRSEKEFMAALIRGNPDDEHPIKLNRPPFQIKGKKLGLDPRRVADYHAKLEKFIGYTGIGELLEDARQNVLQRAESINSLPASFLRDNYEEVKRLLGDAHVWGQIESRLKDL